MPSDSDSQIERQLRDYAAKRRAQASEEEFKIHPVTRNSLKVEIVKQYGRRLPGQNNEPSIWAWLWPRAALFGSGILVLVVAFLIFRPVTPFSERENQTLASNDATDLMENVAPPEPEVDLAGAETIEFTAPQPIALEAAPRIGDSAIGGNDLVFRFKALPQVRSTPEDSVEVSAAALLASFEFRLDGERIHVLGVDNTRYAGNVLEVFDPTIGRTSRAEIDIGDARDPGFPERYRAYSARVAQGGNPSAVAGRFSVTGTNAQSGLTLVFTGTIRPQSGVAGTARAGAMEIVGALTIGGAKEVAIHATTD